jgi:hypothetical protein
MLAKSPGLTVVGVLGMAGAVTICAVAFGTINAMVGQPVPPSASRGSRHS